MTMLIYISLVYVRIKIVTLNPMWVANNRSIGPNVIHFFLWGIISTSAFFFPRVYPMNDYLLDPYVWRILHELNWSLGMRDEGDRTRWRAICDIYSVCTEEYQGMFISWLATLNLECGNVDNFLLEYLRKVTSVPPGKLIKLLEIFKK